MATFLLIPLKKQKYADKWNCPNEINGLENLTTRASFVVPQHFNIFFELAIKNYYRKSLVLFLFEGNIEVFYRQNVDQRKV